MRLIWTLIVGAIIGAIAGAITNRGAAMGWITNRGAAMGWIANIVAGLIGAWIGQGLLGTWGPSLAGMALIPS
ncbi:GlsB/YeaQ/YmgE family stress response membrane protein, partial [Lactobacillus delbrueckii subsp. lactis]